MLPWLRYPAVRGGTRTAWLACSDFSHVRSCASCSASLLLSEHMIFQLNQLRVDRSLPVTGKSRTRMTIHAILRSLACGVVYCVVQLFNPVFGRLRDDTRRIENLCAQSHRSDRASQGVSLRFPRRANALTSLQRRCPIQTSGTTRKLLRQPLPN